MIALILSIAIPFGIILMLSISIILLYYKKKKEFLEDLREHPDFASKIIMRKRLKIQYADSSDENLKKLKEEYNLASVAGQGTEVEQMINLMKWVHMLARRSPNPSFPEKINALNLIILTKTQKQKLNCWLYSTILNEVFLSLGFKSRKINLRPKKRDFKESHYVTEVFSKTLNKWIVFDADFCIYVSDDKNNILGLQEIRQRLIQNKPMKISKEDEYNIKGLFGPLASLVKRKTYLWYISKNIFRFATPLKSIVDYESRGNIREYIEIIPINYYNEDFHSKPVKTGVLTTHYSTNTRLLW